MINKGGGGDYWNGTANKKYIKQVTNRVHLASKRNGTPFLKLQLS